MYGLHGALQVPCNGRAQLQHVKFLLRDALVKDRHLLRLLHFLSDNATNVSRTRSEHDANIDRISLCHSVP